VVYGRQIDGTPVTFGTSGYTMQSVFVLYDRATESLWYPTSAASLEATSGPHRGRTIPFLDKPRPMPLGEWRGLHQRTRVLGPPP